MALHDARVLFPADIDRTDWERDPAAYPIRVLAEGDSWFSFGSWKLNSLLNHLRTSRPACVVTLAHPGETLSRMADICANPQLDLWLSMPYNDIRWSAVLVSGGGNDVIDRAEGGIIPRRDVDQPLKPPHEYVDLGELAQVLAGIRQGYTTIVGLRDRPNSPCIGVPLITHAYDFVTPRDAPAQFLVPLMGPWLYRAMRSGRVPVARWNDVSDFILRELAKTLEELEQALPNFHVARTQGTLTRAALGSTGDSHHWANEIHPNRAGYRKIARLIAEPLEQLT